jgi:hypothetical protein
MPARRRSDAGRSRERAASGTRELLVGALVDPRDLGDPPGPIAVLEPEDAVEVPVEVVGDEGHLLVERVEGVA